MRNVTLFSYFLSFFLSFFYRVGWKFRVIVGQFITRSFKILQTKLKNMHDIRLYTCVLLSTFILTIVPGLCAIDFIKDQYYKFRFEKGMCSISLLLFWNAHTENWIYNEGCVDNNSVMHILFSLHSFRKYEFVWIIEIRCCTFSVDNGMHCSNYFT